MVQVKSFQLPPTSLIPNSSRPLLHYPGFLSSDEKKITVEAYDLFSQNGWQTQWIYRYGPTQPSHYHSKVHECMAVLSGSATIRFGVADTVTDQDEGKEDGGIEVLAQAGDVFVLPAGVAHKTFNTGPSSSFKLLTPGDGHHIAAEDPRQALLNTTLSGFTMMGAYPKEGGAWDFAEGGEHKGDYERIWSVAKPENDPLLGKAEEGLCGQWI